MCRYMILLALVLFTTADIADAGILFRRRCNRVVVTRAVVVNKVVDVQFTPTFVSFVPSQVLLNGQVTTYGAPQTFGYSYQGSYQQQQQQPYQQQVQPAAAAQPDRTDEILRLLRKIAGEDSASASTTSTASIASTHTIFSGGCKGCHSPGGKGSKDLLMYDATGVLKDKLPRYDIYKSIHNGSMPKGGPRIEDPKKLEAVRDWLHKGLPGVEF